MSTTTTVRLPELPEAASWSIAPQSWSYDADGELTIVAGPRSDLFSDPAGSGIVANSPRLLFAPQGDFILQARVQVGFAATYDAGVLLLYADEARWAKLCFERSPQGIPTVVSVVTRERSDDCNGPSIDGSSVWLRIAQLGSAFAFHWSADGSFWNLARYFALGSEASVLVGFSSQSPTGESCTTRFDRISYRAELLRDLRDGS